MINTKKGKNIIKKFIETYEDVLNAKELSHTFADIVNNMVLEDQTYAIENPDSGLCTMKYIDGELHRISPSYQDCVEKELGSGETFSHFFIENEELWEVVENYCKETDKTFITIECAERVEFRFCGMYFGEPDFGITLDYIGE